MWCISRCTGTVAVLFIDIYLVRLVANVYSCFDFGSATWRQPRNAPRRGHGADRVACPAHFFMRILCAREKCVGCVKDTETGWESREDSRPRCRFAVGREVGRRPFLTKMKIGAQRKSDKRNLLLEGKHLLCCFKLSLPGSFASVILPLRLTYAPIFYFRGRVSNFFDRDFARSPSWAPCEKMAGSSRRCFLCSYWRRACCHLGSVVNQREILNQKWNDRRGATLSGK